MNWKIASSTLKCPVGPRARIVGDGQIDYIADKKLLLKGMYQPPTSIAAVAIALAVIFIIMKLLAPTLGTPSHTTTRHHGNHTEIRQWYKLRAPFVPAILIGIYFINKKRRRPIELDITSTMAIREDSTFPENLAMQVHINGKAVWLTFRVLGDRDQLLQLVMSNNNAEIKPVKFLRPGAW